MEVIREMINKGADLNVKDDKSQQTALMIVAMGWRDDSVEMAQLLIDAGADVNAKDYDGRVMYQYLKNLIFLLYSYLQYRILFHHINPLRNK